MEETIGVVSWSWLLRATEAIEYLLVHPKERCRMGANALTRVREHFDLEQAMGKLQQVLLGGL